MHTYNNNYYYSNTMPQLINSLGSRLLRITALFLLLLHKSPTAQACPLEIWTFSSIEVCRLASDNIGALPANSEGTVVADGICRDTVVLSSSLTPPGYELPGTYRAACIPTIADGVPQTSLGSLIFSASGCSGNTCTDPAQGTQCNPDWTTPSPLYGSFGLALEVQNPALRTTGFFNCGQISGSSSTSGGILQVAYAIFGDCRCTQAPTTAWPTIAPSFEPTPQPTNRPTQRPSTAAPSAFPTPSPVVPVTTPGTPPADTTPESPTQATPPSTPATTTTAATTSVTDGTEPNPTDASTIAPSLQPTTSPPSAGEPTDSFVPSNGGSSSSNSAVPLMAGGAAGGAVGVALIAFAVWFFVVRGKSPRKKDASSDSILPEGDSPTTQSKTLPPNNPVASPYTALFGEVVCSKDDDVSTLGEPIGLEGAVDRTDESTVSTPSTFMRNLLSDNQSRMDASTATDPDALLAAADTQEDDQSFEQIYSPNGRSHEKSHNVLRFHINVPPGRLGMLLDQGSDGRPMVHTIKEDSVFRSHPVQVGDSLVAVDDTDVSRMSATRVSQLIVSKAKQPRRLFTFERVSDDDRSEQEV